MEQDEELITKHLNVYIDKNVKINDDDVKFLINASVVSIFGILEANKIKYSIKQDKTEFALRTYKRHINKIQTALSLINTKDYKIRIK